MTHIVDDTLSISPSATEMMDLQFSRYEVGLLIAGMVTFVERLENEPQFEGSESLRMAQELQMKLVTMMAVSNQLKN